MCGGAIISDSMPRRALTRRLSASYLWPDSVDAPIIHDLAPRRKARLLTASSICPNSFGKPKNSQFTDILSNVICRLTPYIKVFGDCGWIKALYGVIYGVMMFTFDIQII